MPTAMKLADGTTDEAHAESSNLNKSYTTANEESKPRPLQKQHTITICMVPPATATKVWTDVTRARTELKDPGLYRWPPHANMLYPFIEIKHDLEEIAQKLRNATSKCPPFQVSVDMLGTFGGKNRGVLWLYPKSYRDNDIDGIQDEEPLIELQAMLEEQFPTCTDQRKSGRFTPHMTLSHFASLEDAQNAQAQVESWWPSNVKFHIREIYLLQRKGDDGQFLRVATITLGDVADSSGISIHEAPEAFPDMPTVEEDWVREERMKLKERRSGSWKGRRRSNGGRRRALSADSPGPSRSTDTPEIIAAKRAARKEKRERLEREKLHENNRDNNE